MEKVKQNIKSQNVGSPSISGKYLYWIIIIYGLASFLRVIGIGFTYIEFLATGNVYEPSIHNLGNILIILTTIFAMPTILLVIFLKIKRVHFSIILVPLLYVLVPLLEILLAFISLSFFGVPLYNSEFSNTFVFRILTNNYFLMIYYLGIVFYSIKQWNRIYK